MTVRYKYKPVPFFFLAYAVSWGLGFSAAYCSYHEALRSFSNPLLYAGAFGPSIGALIMLLTSGSSSLKRDYVDRVFNLRRFSPIYVLITVLIIPVTMYLAVLISEYFGAPHTQLIPAMNINTLTPLPLVFLAPLFEELGWHGYGVDALREKMGTLRMTMFFALLWLVWHTPLIFVKDNYLQVLLSNPLWFINWAVSIVPVAILSNWLYYRNDRLILSVVLLHFAGDAVAVMLNIGQLAKGIETVLLYIVAFLVLILDREIFRQGSQNFLEEET